MQVIMICLLIFLGIFIGCHGYHDLSNSGIMANWDYHCWPIGNYVDAYDDCAGVEMEWINPPPAEIRAEAPFNVSYLLHLEDPFFDWAAQEGRFTYNSLTNGSEVKDFLETTICPEDFMSVNKFSCPIYHVNVHSCPLGDGLSFCGPWIPANGTIVTHSDVLWGQINRTVWTSYVSGLYIEGSQELIAHFKIGELQTTLRWSLVVLPKFVCGDGSCDAEDNEDCGTCPADCGTCPLEAWQLALIAIFAAIFVFTILGVIIYFQYKQARLLYDESWIIPYEEIKPDTAVRGFMGSAISVQESNTSSYGVAGEASNSKMAASAANKQVFTETGMFCGATVAIKKVPRKEYKLTRAIRKEVKLMRTMDCPNIARFVGACVQIGDFCILTEYCPKGSLNDVLLNDDVPLNWAFRFSFASDICRALRFIQSKGIVHGNLKSNNCIIDDRWTVKVTDFGVPSLRMAQMTEDEQEDWEWKQKRAAVYRAPETSEPGYTPTAAADVYAFGIILIEIATRNEPYGDEDFACVELGWKPPLPDLVSHNKSEDSCPCPDKYNKLVGQCYDNNPSQRLDFEGVKKSIQKINPIKQSPVDLMMSMMEKYSKHLESIVSERTADLVVEKQKTDRLLYSMLPKAVADDLRIGRTIEAVMYDECTIYFSDIVGFTAISGRSKPIEVVGLLNKLYICFDSIIDSYDVYKVETIGDAYMVVSGVPRLNGHLHAREISNMAMDIVEACLVFVIPHLPEEALKIRVGLHSGGVCAGVVGLKMPRYCLFGDTVNTASRMESNGEPYKVHISNFTKEYLADIGGFEMELRGTIPVKGKGDMKTWWLTGRTKAPATQEDELQKINQEIDEVLLPSTDQDDQKKDELRKISATDSGFNEKVTGEQKMDLPGVPTSNKR